MNTIDHLEAELSLSIQQTQEDITSLELRLGELHYLMECGETHDWELSAIHQKLGEYYRRLWIWKDQLNNLDPTVRMDKMDTIMECLLNASHPSQITTEMVEEILEYMIRNGFELTDDRILMTWDLLY